MTWNSDTLKDFWSVFLLPPFLGNYHMLMAVKWPPSRMRITREEPRKKS